MTSKPKAAEKRPVGRPSEYSEAIANDICARLIDGESLVDICADEAMPSRATVYRWQDANTVFEARCARAREGQADYMDSLILKTANACKAETARADRVKIAAYQWRASKLAPKRYGDKVAVTGGGTDDAPIRTELTLNFVRPKPDGV